MPLNKYIKTIIFTPIVLLFIASMGGGTYYDILAINTNNASASAAHPSDINNDNAVNIVDLSTLLSNWDKIGINNSDINNDNVVNIFDLSTLLDSWGPVGNSNIFNTSFNPSKGLTAGWQNETSGAQESIQIVNERAECTAGGYTAATHYARVRRKLPEQDDFVATKNFSLKADFEIPSNFYDQQESYIRLFNTDNFPGVYKTSGLTVGAASADEWRLGFLIYGGDKLPRLQSAHENHQTLTLWQGAQSLPTGRHTIELNFTPSLSATGSWGLWIDGIKVGGQSGVITAPTTLAPSEVAVTRVVGCIDGAADQDTKAINNNLYSLDFTATK